MACQYTKPERLILMAAGYGSRMRPVTDETPKPLVRVRGKRMIDDTIEAALEAGIDDIVLVRGYKAEQFDELLDDFPMVRFVENPWYDQGNNILSMYLVRHLLGNSFVAEADLVLRNHGLLAGEQAFSNYLGVPCGHTDDWAFRAESKECGPCIVDLLSTGGDNVHHMFGISYWTVEDAGKLSKELERVVEMPGGRDRYFEEVPLALYKDHHDVYVRECTFDDIVELDTLEELIAEDPSWKKWQAVR